MANDIIGSMFGVDPNQIAMQNLQRAYQQNAQMASQDPLSGGLMANVGANIGMLGAKAMGLKTREEQVAENRQQIAQMIDKDEPDSYIKAANRAHELGDTQAATALIKEAADLRKQKQAMSFQAAQEKLAEGRLAALSDENRKAGVRPVNIGNGMLQDYKVDAAGNVTGEKIGVAYKSPDALKSEKSGSEKPVPVAVHKFKTELEDSLNTSSQISKDTQAWAEKIKSGKLNLNLLDNIQGKLAVKVGVAGEDAVELANFATYIEQLRNDRMLLAKGTQTEGDAIRELNGIVSGISDPKYVSTRLDVLSKNATEKERKTELQLGGLNKQYKFEDYNIGDFKAKSSPYAVQQKTEQPKAQSGGWSATIRK